jgi:hypothetical protein
MQMSRRFLLLIHLIALSIALWGQSAKAPIDAAATAH